MALLIKQKPLNPVPFGSGYDFSGMPVGQQIIFSVIDTDAVANYFNVKYRAAVYVFTSTPTASDVIGTFETTPNNAGAGIWDFRPILETFVSPDNIAPVASNVDVGVYKGTEVPNTPIHLVDRFSINANSMKRFSIVFSVYGGATATDPVVQIGSSIVIGVFHIFNGVLQYDDVLTLDNDNYGYALNYAQAYPYTPVGLYTASDSGGQKFLSNAPTTQYANKDDYGTFAFLNFMQLEDNYGAVGRVYFNYYDSADVLLGTEYLYQPYGQNNIKAWNELMYAGVFPGNIRGWSSVFDGLITAGTLDGGYYTVQAQTKAGSKYSALYTIHINCATDPGYEPIRLTWLNQWGVWDYYTFIQKSVKSISTKKAPYTQISGTWNEETLAISGYQGGRKNFRVNTSEKIKMNTGYVTEHEGYWFEELINSPEVYILNGYDGTEVANYNRITNKYVEPVTLTTSSYIRKTVANDKLMQYTFEVEKSKNRRTQAV